MATSTNVDGLVLNVWDDEDRGWQMAIYPDTAEGIDTQQYISIKPTPEQIERYLELSEDSDWWTGATRSINYILAGVDCE